MENDEEGSEIAANNHPAVNLPKCKKGKKEDVAEKPFICVYTNETDVVGFNSEDLISVETVISNNTTYSYSRMAFMRITLQTRIGVKYVDVPIEFKEKLVEALKLCRPVIVLNVPKGDK